MKAHEFLTKDNWGKGKYAADKNGNCVSEFSNDACKFCLIGAIRKCYYKDKEGSLERTKEYIVALDKFFDVIKNSYEGNLIDWNDAPERTFEDVHELLVKLDV